MSNTETRARDLAVGTIIDTMELDMEALEAARQDGDAEAAQEMESAVMSAHYEYAVIETISVEHGHVVIGTSNGTYTLAPERKVDVVS